MKLISLIPLHLREAEADEKQETPTDDSEGDTENPFAAADDSGEDSGEGDASAATPEDGEGEKEGDDQRSLEINFDASRVRKYNDQTFKDGKGVVVGVSRFGVTVKLPDEKTVFVNFEDIL